MVTATELLKTRVTPGTKRIIQALAQRQQLTEPAWRRPPIVCYPTASGRWLCENIADYTRFTKSP